MQSFLHDGKVVFEQIEQFGLNTWPLLQSSQNESCDFDGLSISPRAGGYDWYVVHNKFLSFALASPLRHDNVVLRQVIKIHNSVQSEISCCRRAALLEYPQCP
jgi:hypothetical protein